MAKKASQRQLYSLFEIIWIFQNVNRFDTTLSCLPDRLNAFSFPFSSCLLILKKRITHIFALQFQWDQWTSIFFIYPIDNSTKFIIIYSIDEPVNINVLHLR